MAVLIIAEHDNCDLKDVTLKAISAGISLCDELDLLIVGYGCFSLAEKAAVVTGISRVLLAESETYADQLAENIAELVARVGRNYTHIIAAATASAKNILPRVAALLDVSLISEVIGIESKDTFHKSMYSGRVMATVQSLDPIKVIIVRSTTFSLPAEGCSSARIELLDPVEEISASRVVANHIIRTERPELVSARVVVSGGRGIGSAENFILLESLADKLGAAVGATRAAVDAGYVDNDLQIGQTGKVVAPELYIAIGISGAIQHTSGIKDAKTIVAINCDPDAPIFQVADYFLVADYFDVLPDLIKRI